MNVKKYFEKHVNQIDTIVRVTCNKKNITGELAKDFGSYVYEKLLENDCKRIRDFQGDYDASWTGYLSVVILRLAIDFTKKHWGRWENSSAARALGEAAMKFETLIYRDGYSFSEASNMMLEHPEYEILFRLSQDELPGLKSSLPETVFKKLKDQSKQTLYSPTEFKKLTTETLTEKELEYSEDILNECKKMMSLQMLEAWDLIFQGRIPPTKSVSLTISSHKDQDDPDLDLLENIQDKEDQTPLEQLLDKELENQLTEFIEKLVQNLNDEDWAIISFYLIDNLRISEIVRIIDPSIGEKQNRDDSKPPVSSKSWKYVNKRINLFMKQIRKKIDTLPIDREDWESLSQYCLFLIYKKMQKKS